MMNRQPMLWEIREIIALTLLKGAISIWPPNKRRKPLARGINSFIREAEWEDADPA